MLDRLMQELKATGLEFRRGGWAKAPATDYGAVALDGAGATVWADGAMVEQALTGTVDMYTRDEGIPQMLAVQQAFKRAGVSWRLNTVIYERDTRLTHYEWTFELEAV